MLFKFRYDRPYRIQRNYRATLVFVEVNKVVIGKIALELRDNEDFKTDNIKYYDEFLIDIDLPNPFDKNSDGEYICNTVYAYLSDRSRCREYNQKSDFDKYKLVSITSFPVHISSPASVTEIAELNQDLRAMGIDDLDLQKPALNPSRYF